MGIDVFDLICRMVSDDPDLRPSIDEVLDVLGEYVGKTEKYIGMVEK